MSLSYCIAYGKSAADRDNIYFGGISIGVNSDGTLMETAFSEYGEILDKHPDSGVVFKNYKVDGADGGIQKMVIKCHEKLPWLGFLSWDLSIDDTNNVVLIEVNTTGQSAWFPQMVNGKPLFGENTGKILELIRKK